MNKIYKLFQSTRTVFCVLCLILITAFSAQAYASTDKIFTIKSVTVDVTAESAAAAREQAFSKAQYDAFTQLAARLLSEEQLEFFQAPPGSVISALIKDFEILEEQLSDVRYIGTYAFRFKNDAVRNYLGANGFAYTDVGSKPVLILPFYQNGANTVLWDNTNLWLKAWNNSQFYEGLVPVIIPIGDLQDVSAINDNQALSYDPAELADMTRRYKAGETIIMIASPTWKRRADAQSGLPPSKLTINVYRTNEASPQFANRFVVTNENVKGSEDIFTAAVRIGRDNLQKAWKSQTLTYASQDNKLKVRVQFSHMREWIETQKKLRRVQGISEIKLLSLKQDQAHVEIMFRGDENRLRLALSQADMTLSQPSVHFGNSSYNYMDRAQRISPLAYDLYLNKYRPQPSQYP